MEGVLLDIGMRTRFTNIGVSAHSHVCSTLASKRMHGLKLLENIARNV